MINLCKRIPKFMLIVILLFLSVISLIETQRNGREEWGEIVNGAPIYKNTDNIFLFLLFLFLLIGFIFLLKLIFDKKPYVYTFLADHITLFQKILALICGFLSFLILSGGTHTPGADQIQVYGAAQLFNEGNYYNLTKGGYVNMYPQQLGYILYLQLILSFAGTLGFFAVQMINCFFIAGVVYSACLFLNDLTNDLIPRIIGSLFFLILLPLQYMGSWVYGDIPFYFFMFLFFHHFLQAHRTGSKRHIIATVITAIFCIIFRKHALILLVAVAIVSLVSFVEKHYKYYLVIGLLSFCLPLLTVSCINKYYASVSGYEIDGGIPSIAWITMGAIESGSKPGWFDNYCVPLYYSTDCDRTMTSKLATEQLLNQITYLKENPVYAVSFYKRKICTQWNDPFFGTDHMIYVDQNESPKGLSAFFIENESTVLTLLSVLQSLIYLGTLLYFFFVSYKSDYAETLPEMAVLGGFLFSILWEANSRYVFPYYMIMLPLAAIGWYQLLHRQKFFQQRFQFLSRHL